MTKQKQEDKHYIKYVQCKVIEPKPKTLTTICDNYNKPEAQIHCTGMACDGLKAYFCYMPSKVKKIGDYQI